jgi:hypothetical protein
VLLVLLCLGWRRHWLNACCHWLKADLSPPASLTPFRGMDPHGVAIDGPPMQAMASLDKEALAI